MSEKEPLPIEQKIEAGPGATIRDIQQTVYLRPPPGIPFQAPAVPRYFVPRPEVSGALTDYLTAEAPPGALVVSAVHGLGGIGKTTLVAALAHDPAVQARFPDGVLWATLGQQPDILSLLAGWIQALGDYDFHPTIIEMASPHLRTLLHDKACLLVVDDAWQTDHVRPFLMGGGRCQILITTRDAALARKLGAQLYDLDVMTEVQALNLFQARLGPLGGHREQAAALAHELGYLPLALELAAAQVEAGISWTELLNAFRQELADLDALELDEATYRNESLRLSFRLSLERLSSEDQDAFVWLGVLPEDVRLNAAMAATLWNQPEADTRKRLRRLRDKALLKTIAADEYTIHDLLHDEAKVRLKEQMPLPKAHALFLDRCKHKHQVAYDRWDRLPDDGYIHAYLTWHMEQAGQPAAIHTLLRLETQEGHNAWYEARDALGQTTGYLDDVRRAWRLAEKIFFPDDGVRMAQSIGLQNRCALIITSLNSQAKNIPPALASALVEKGIWVPAQGLAYARQVPDPEQQMLALAELTPYLPKSLLREALAVAWKIGDEWYRAGVMMKLAPHLSESLLREALVAVREIHNEEYQAEALVDLAPHLPEPERRQVLQEALAVMRKIEDEEDQAEPLAELALSLSKPSQREALTAMRESRRRAIWKRYLPQTPLTELTSHLQETLATVWKIEDEGHRVEVLAGLAPHLSEPLLREALVAVREIGDEGYRARALARLAPHLSEPLLREALVAVQEIGYIEHRVGALARLAPYLTTLPIPTLYALWRETLPILTHCTRRDLLADIRAFEPPITALGGAGAVAETICAIQDVGRWWP